MGSAAPGSPTHTPKGEADRSTRVTLAVTSSAPNRAAWARMAVMSSGPMIPSGKPGKFSTSVVSMSWPPGWSLVEDGSPSITSGLELGPGGVDGGGEAGRARSRR